MIRHWLVVEDRPCEHEGESHDAHLRRTLNLPRSRGAMVRVAGEGEGAGELAADSTSFYPPRPKGNLSKFGVLSIKRQLPRWILYHPRHLIFQHVHYSRTANLTSQCT